MKAAAYVAVVIVLFAALFFFFKPADQPQPSGTVAVAPNPAPAPAAAPAAASAPSALAEAAEPASQAATAAPAVAADAEPTRIDLVVAKGRLVSGPNVVKAKKGDHVVLSITSDSADELHVHGINLHLKLAPGQKATLDFIASRTGRFTYELHHADLELGALEVYPR